ncbi:MAG: type II CAAX prenyl endopeptidase Rce1 family protein [Candidatus Hodarchaeota archaeon]
MLIWMIQPLHFQFCPNCKKKTPTDNYCVFCGEILTNARLCSRCQASIPINTNYCPFCGHPNLSIPDQLTIKETPQINRYLVQFRAAVLIIFLLSAYSLAQFIIGSFMILFLPNETAIDSFEVDFISLVSMLLSSIFMIFLLTRWVPFSVHKNPPVKKNKMTIILLLVILIVSVSIIEVLVVIVDFGLDIIRMNPSHSSPYDAYFMNPINSLVFLLLAVIIGPILEELIFRRFTISLLSSYSQSKLVVLSISALIFGLTHTTADLLEGSLRYAILHLIATFCLGVILGIIFVTFNLKYAIIFHSLWNIFSFITQILVINGYIDLVDSILLFFIVITVFLACITLFWYKSSLLETIKGTTVPTSREFFSICLNFILIIVYQVLLPLILFSYNLNIITAGIIFFIQVIGVLLGIVFIDREKKIKSFKSSLQEF